MWSIVLSIGHVGAVQDVGAGQGVDSSSGCGEVLPNPMLVCSQSFSRHERIHGENNGSEPYEDSREPPARCDHGAKGKKMKGEIIFSFLSDSLCLTLSSLHNFCEAILHQSASPVRSGLGRLVGDVGLR